MRSKVPESKKSLNSLTQSESVGFSGMVDSTAKAASGSTFASEKHVTHSSTTVSDAVEHTARNESQTDE